MNGHPLIEWRKFRAWCRSVWAESLGVVIALVLGILIGVLYRQTDITEDCRYSGSFRVGTQAFNCQRRM
jgi:ABC-type nitrate/sulfonate/bicarbonate transport system permease component